MKESFSTKGTIVIIFAIFGMGFILGAMFSKIFWGG